MWREIRFETLPLPDERSILELLDALRNAFTNGGALLSCFHVHEHWAFDWLASRNILHAWRGSVKPRFFENFLTSAVVTGVLPELHLEGALFDSPEFECLQGNEMRTPSGFEWASAFTLDGEIAEQLVLGPMYGEFPGTPVEAKRLGEKFCEAVFEGRYTEVQVYRSYERWHEWFSYVESVSWLWIDKRHRRIWLLCITDTD
ncbi:MAG: hypothetical protein ACR2GU_15145 [Rubrobacteraceae bacterium]